MPGFTPKLPLSIDKTDINYTLTKNLKETLQQNLKNLLLTEPGERVFDMEFGVGIRKYLFENYSIFLAEEIEDKIRGQINKYIPALTVENVNIKFSDENNLLSINLRYYIENPPLQDILSLDLIRK